MSSMPHHNRAFGQQFGSRDMGFRQNFSFNFEAVDDVFVITSTQIRQVRRPQQFGRRNMGFYPNGRQNFPLYSEDIDDVVVISPTQMRQGRQQFGRRNMGFYPNGRQNFPLYSEDIDDVVVISPTQMRQVRSNHSRQNDTMMVLDDDSMMNWVLNESMEFAISNRSAAPASASSVEALKMVNFTSEVFGDVICVVCQEEFLEGEAVVQMPCFHIFHSQCILQWLKQSHFCPICRFEILQQ